MKRKAQSASSAAAFIAIMTVLIIMYILFLPPADREALLSDGTGSDGGTGGTGGGNIDTQVLLTQTIGHVSFISTNEKVYTIPTVRVYSPTSAQVLKLVPGIYVKNALFDKEKATFEFNFDVDTAATDNTMLSFNVKDHYGPIEKRER